MAFVSGFAGARLDKVGRATCGRAVVRADVGYVSAGNKDDLMANGGKKVIKVNGAKVLVKEFAGDVFAVSNSCSHLGLPLEGKVLKAKYTDDGNVICSAHQTEFDLKTGEVVGEWCPKMPNLPFVGKMKQEQPLKTYEVKMDGNEIMIKAD
mmetsp:Transcript_10053/g.30708  ORF Transcript_10053/g.30708 Transcript_10053/m.30708 type:complete len:151 (+) Transcript_10053:60-512(+)|eukprot:CAMPEP_0198724640 /NCGR_PEP_ID=MMETSP1475-20131203/2096_1 /TAXON_ID= ORGANISM="Unidentified sp., Strain CCMP1999" /NCGR_SAMPLE_ID=MMETSP1475 /ASSEMBLY_ACC=CAM_ASM_001111 /LENGTH=150 /DNA_ID=CAMNT_0044486227 /DNA_START=47 /DNA_END=499 /DNA_ORIENTATION=-